MRGDERGVRGGSSECRRGDLMCEYPAAIMFYSGYCGYIWVFIIALVFYLNVLNKVCNELFFSFLFFSFLFFSFLFFSFDFVLRISFLCFL